MKFTVNKIVTRTLNIFSKINNELLELQCKIFENKKGLVKTVFQCIKVTCIFRTRKIVMFRYWCTGMLLFISIEPSPGSNVYGLYSYADVK